MSTYEAISAKHDEVAREIVDAAIKVHRTLGPGLLESVYEQCLQHELTNRGRTALRQVPVPVIYDGIAIETVNVSRLGIEVLRVPDRILSQHTIYQGESNEEGGWGYWGFNSAGEDVGVQVYEGEIDVDASRRNSAVTTVFALGAALRDLRPGAYVVKVRDASPSAGQRGDRDNDSVASSYRWILYTDMALQSFSGASGPHTLPDGSAPRLPSCKRCSMRSRSSTS